MKNTNLTECSAAMRESRIHLNQRPGNKPVISRIITLILAGLILPVGSLTFSGCGKDEQAEMKSGCGKDEQAEMKEAIAKEMAKPIQHRRMMPDDMTLDEIIQQLKKYAQTGEAGVRKIDMRPFRKDPKYEAFRYDEELLWHYSLLCDGLETINDYSYLYSIVRAAQRGPNCLPTGRYIRSLIHLGAYHSLNTDEYLGRCYQWETKTVKMLIDDYKNRPDLYPKNFINNFFLDIKNAQRDDENAQRDDAKGSEQIKLVLEAGADSNTKVDETGSTALMRAAHRGYEKTAKLLLEHGADVNAKDKDGATALMLATSHGHENTARLLLEHGADVNAKNTNKVETYTDRQGVVYEVGSSALMIAAKGGRNEIAKLLLEHGADVNAKNNAGESALLNAISAIHRLYGNYEKGNEMVRLLLEHGADANAKDNNGMTALIRAAYRGYEKTAKLLLEHGADVNTKDNDGMTPLMFAASNSYEKTVTLLLEHGADADLRNADGMTARELVARDSGYYLRSDKEQERAARESITNLLMKHEKKD